MSLALVPLTLAEANRFIELEHRHHRPVVGCRFAIGAAISEKLVGVVIVGRPVARRTDAHATAEVTRLATDGTPNACSFLYSAAARAARAMGYRRIQTFILESEPGTSLRAAGWALDGMTPGRPWNDAPTGQLTLAGSMRRNEHAMGPRARWVKAL